MKMHVNKRTHQNAMMIERELIAAMLALHLVHVSRCVLEPPVLPADLFVLSPGYKVLLDLATVPPPFSMRGLCSRCPQRRFECSK